MAESEEGGSGHKEQPIIIKKIKKGGHGHHGGAWKVAYADLVTAMLAFFIVMWALAQSDDVKAAIADYFQNPEEYEMFSGKKISPVSIFDNAAPQRDGTGKGASNLDDAMFDAALEAAYKAANPDDSSVTIDEIRQARRDSIEYSHVIEKTAEELKQLFKDLANASDPETKKMLEAIEIEITKEGLRIELLETHDNNFFDIGSANLKPNAVAILRQLSQQIGKLGNYVEIEGHTDSRAFPSASGYTNWELSSQRANSARRVLESNGFWNGQIVTVSGFADRKLRQPNNPFDFSNRRVSILVKNLSVKDFIDNHGQTPQ